MGYSKNIQSLRDELELFYGAPTAVISDCLRGFLVPEAGHVFIGCDLAQIEARILAWLARATDRLDRFRRGEDIYVATARRIYDERSHQIDSQKRLVGKIAELACGYGGGKGAFQRFAKTFQVSMTDTHATAVVARWREVNSKIVVYWDRLEGAAMQALKTNKPVSIGKITYEKKGSFLLCRLPSGREIVYPYPRIDMLPMPWGDVAPGITAKTVDSATRKWERRKIWYGILVENVVQAIARDVLVHGMQLLEKAQYPVINHAHDEVTCEVLDIGNHETLKKKVETCMTTLPPWAMGLPLSATAWAGYRYRKD